MASASRSFTVVADSTCDLPSELLAENGIDMVPLSVMFGDETFDDRVLTQDQFFQRMNAASQLPTTSQPAVGLFVEAYERALESAESVISVHISEKLSGTIESARSAAEQFAGRVHIFDSRNLSLALGFQVLEAATCSLQGLSVAETLERLESVRRRVKMIVALDSLKNLAKGGRIGRVSAFLGGMLDMKVTLTVDDDGAFQPVKRVRGEHAALQHTLDWVTDRMGTSKRGKFAVGFAQHPERADWLREQIESRYDASQMVVYETGSVIATHTGSGWGITVLPE